MRRLNPANTVRRFLLLATLLLSHLSIAVAEPLPEADLPVRCTSWHIAYDVNADGSFVESQKWSMVVLKESALEKRKTASITFSTSVAKGEILDAYTLKKSGQRIDAPKSSYQVTVNDGYDNASPLYSDETTISVVFPDLAVGDTTVFSFRITNSEGMFPDQFSMAHGFSRFLPYDDVRIRVVAPKAMELRHEAYFLTPEKPQETDGKQVLEWTYQNRSPEKWTPADSGISFVGEEPSLYVSTFGSYREIAEAYGSRATPKAAATGRVKTLAAQIVADRIAPDAQARALYDWVARNISYGGNCIGIGAVVPRDLDVVLDNRMGDCKDHATLLQALLAARDIESEQALVNAGSRYDLPNVPVVATINHVINYLPGLNLYLDATASTVPFGMLPESLGEKPVLLVSHFREGAKIPSTARYGHEQVMRTKIRINPDGTATGTTRVSLRGLPATGMREAMRNLRSDQEEFAVRSSLESQGVHGSGTLQKDDPKELLDVYSYNVSFNLEDLLVVASTTGMPIKPVVYSMFPIEAFTGNAYEPTPKKATVCYGGRSVEEYVYEFPDSMTIVGFPKDFEYSGPALDYRATYRKSGNTLTVTRDLRDKTTSNICSPEHVADYQKSARNILRDLRSQVLISD
jgi:transglutaminase-like putative cysteine protease